MEKTFQTLNELETAGSVTRYAIGGAFALSFYTEPIVTETVARARASARFTVRKPDAFNLISRLTSVGTLKRRERRAPFQPAEIPNPSNSTGLKTWASAVLRD